MSFIDGERDLKDVEIYGFQADGTVLVNGGDKGLIPCKMFVTDAGHTRIVRKKQPDHGVDQDQEPRRPTVADRMRGVDQA